MTNLKSFLIFFISFLSCCSTVVEVRNHKQFNKKTHQKLKPLLLRFEDKKDFFGKISKKLIATDKTYSQIKFFLIEKNKCKQEIGNITDYLTKKPKLHKSLTIPMVFFICNDGSVIRVKKEGNPGDPYHSEPHLTKGVLFRPGLDIKNFDNEAFKVDDRGRAQPKWPKDLSPTSSITNWSKLTHIYFKTK